MDYFILEGKTPPKVGESVDYYAYKIHQDTILLYSTQDEPYVFDIGQGQDTDYIAIGFDKLEHTLVRKK